jgi:hypothetical protein
VFHSYYLFCLFASLSFLLSVCLSICLSVSLYLCLSICLFLSVSVSVSLSLSLSLCLSLSLSLSRSFSVPGTSKGFYSSDRICHFSVFEDSILAPEKIFTKYRSTISSGQIKKKTFFIVLYSGCLDNLERLQLSKFLITLCIYYHWQKFDISQKHSSLFYYSIHATEKVL